MGDPKRIRAKYTGPGHPWQKERIEQETVLIKEYGLKNKTEIWKQASKLKNFASQAKRLVALTSAQAEKEKKQLITRLNRIGLLEKDAKLDDVLGLTIKDLLERRLQTLVCRKGLARSMKQARQFITHAHISVAGKKVKAPAYIVATKDEPTITFIEASTLADVEHPERKVEKKVLPEKIVEKGKEPEKKAKLKTKPETKPGKKPEKKAEKSKQ